MGSKSSKEDMSQEDYDKLTAEQKCQMEMNHNYHGMATKFVGFVVMVALCNILQSKRLFKKFSVPRIALDILVSFFAAEPKNINS